MMMYRPIQKEPEELESVTFWRLLVDLYKAYRKKSAFYIVLRKRRDGKYFIEEHASLVFERKL